jgi:glycosyltransferase involved in cell wall biosynthesis
MSAQPAPHFASAATAPPKLSVFRPADNLFLPFDESNPPVLSYDPGAEFDLTIFVACYNEEQNIVDTLDTIVAAMDELDCRYEIIVVDDASRDRSVELVEAYNRDHPEVPLLLKVNPRNRGLGRNFVEAAFLGRGRYYRLVCGDNVESRETLVDLLRHLGQADLVLPYHEVCEGKSAGRIALSRTYTRLINLLSGNRLKYYNGCALYLRYHVMRWHSRSNGFGFQADLVTRLLEEGASHLEVFSPARDRTKGAARALTLRNLASVAHVALAILLRRLRRLSAAGGSNG